MILQMLNILSCMQLKVKKLQIQLWCKSVPELTYPAASHFVILQWNIFNILLAIGNLIKMYNIAARTISLLYVNIYPHFQGCWDLIMLLIGSFFILNYISLILSPISLLKCHIPWHSSVHGLCCSFPGVSLWTKREHYSFNRIHIPVWIFNW